MALDEAVWAEGVSQLFILWLVLICYFCICDSLFLFISYLSFGLLEPKSFEHDFITFSKRIHSNPRSYQDVLDHVSL